MGKEQANKSASLAPRRAGSRLLLSGLGLSSLLLTGCDSPRTASYADCEKEPKGVSTAEAHPGREGTQYFGAGRLEEGQVQWQAKIELYEQKDSFSVGADGFGPGDIKYSSVPPGADQTLYLFDSLKPVGRVDANANNFNTAEPNNPANVVSVRFHCGPRPDKL
jgi:hypothetical protein